MKKTSTNSPKVTVGIPLYASVRFIDTIIANIEAMPKDGVEILISDRHCKDNTIEQLKQRYSDDSRILFFTAQDELDWVGNINFLLQEANGEYWRFLPHDDISPIGSLEALISALDDNHDAILAYGPTKAIDLDGLHLPQKDVLPSYVGQPISNWTSVVGLKMFLQGKYSGAFKGLVRRELLYKNSLYIRSTLGQVFPESCWLFALCLLGPFIFVPEASYIKRYYPDSTHAQWNISGKNYLSAAWTIITYLGSLLKSLSIRSMKH